MKLKTTVLFPLLLISLSLFSQPYHIDNQIPQPTIQSGPKANQIQTQDEDNGNFVVYTTTDTLTGECLIATKRGGSAIETIFNSFHAHSLPVRVLSAKVIDNKYLLIITRTIAKDQALHYISFRSFEWRNSWIPLNYPIVYSFAEPAGNIKWPEDKEKHRAEITIETPKSIHVQYNPGYSVDWKFDDVTKKITSKGRYHN